MTDYNIAYSAEAILFFLFSMKQRPESFSNFGWPDYLFYLQKLPDYTDHEMSSPIIGTCIRKLISRHCLDKPRTRWNDFLFLITDDRDFRPQTCTTGLVFRECKHIMNIFKDVYFTKTSFYISLAITHVILKYPFTWLAIKTNKTESDPLQI